MLSPDKKVKLERLLNEKLETYEQPEFIDDDPISIPHKFNSLQDIEIMGFFAAILAWGQRKTIINKCNELIERFDGAPYQFITQHQEQDLKRLLGFKHRTFNDTDLLYFVQFFKHYYAQHHSLEQAFARHLPPGAPHVGPALEGFRNDFFSLPDAPHRTGKHIASPVKGSTCKRINMYLRWMVRSDRFGVDFGLWKEISPAQLLCPLDVHVDRVARRLGLITIPQTNFKAVLELTANLKELDADDPVKYDLALFGLGVVEKF